LLKEIVKRKESIRKEIVDMEEKVHGAKNKMLEAPLYEVFTL
jgi:hypothetical protein